VNLESKYLIEAKELESQGNFQEAEQKYLLALEQAPRSLRSLQGLANLFYKQKKWLHAIIYFRKIIQIYPTDEIYYKLGECYLNNENVHLAVYFLKKSIELNPHYINALILLVKMFTKSGNYYKKEIYLLHILKADPKHHYALLELMDLYTSTFRYKEALEIIEKFLQYYSEGDQKLELKLIELYIKMGKYATAASTLSEKLKQDPKLQELIKKFNLLDKRKTLQKLIQEKKTKFKNLEYQNQYDFKLSFEISLLYLMLGKFFESAKFLIYSKKLKEETKMKLN
jgi:tetratricopeptide (TPR) repeat protein